MYYKLICILYALLCGQKIYSCKKWVLHGFSQFDLKTGGFGFPGLGLKTGSYGLVI
jgi:hypothetical protein